MVWRAELAPLGQGKPALRALSHSSVLAAALLLFSVLTLFPTWNAFGAFHLAKSDCSGEAKLKHPPSLETSLCLPYAVIGPLSCSHTLLESTDTWVKHSCSLVCFPASQGFSHQCVPAASPVSDNCWLWNEKGISPSPSNKRMQ